MPAGTPTDEHVAPAALIDTHAHLYDGFDPGAFLSAAAVNLDGTARSAGIRSDPAPARALLILEAAGRSLEERLDVPELTDWTFERADSAGFRAHHQSHGTLVLIEGRQVVSSEGLEVLAAPCGAGLGPDAKAEVLIGQATDLGAVPILPWGFGKWLGRRGREISRLLEISDPDRFLVADNGGRPALSLRPRLLTLAAQRGFGVLCGSDPLPLRGEERRVGRDGSIFLRSFDLDRPSDSTRSLLTDRSHSPRPFGRGLGWPSFVWNQTRLRFPGARL